MFSVRRIFRIQFLTNNSWKIEICPQITNAAIVGLTLFGSAIFGELGAVLFVYYDVMGGWYDSLHRGDTNHTFDAPLIDVFLGYFLRLFGKEYR